MTDYFQDRIKLNPSIDIQTTVKGGGGGGEGSVDNSGNEIWGVGGDGLSATTSRINSMGEDGASVKEFPSQSATLGQ